MRWTYAELSARVDIMYCVCRSTRHALRATFNRVEMTPTFKGGLARNRMAQRNAAWLVDATRCLGISAWEYDYLGLRNFSTKLSASPMAQISVAILILF